MAESNRGFGGMSDEEQRKIASKGGKASHQQGTGHEFSSREAAEAGRKGGQASRSGGRGGSSGRSSSQRGGSSQQHAKAGSQSHKNA